MKKIKLTSELLIHDSIEALSPDDKHLMQQAIEARKKAYAPYSKFSVGAAVLLANQKIVLGNNQENAAYPSGLCAERVAIFNANANHPGIPMLQIAISASSTLNEVKHPVAPCGACRQSISEYEISQEQAIRILFMGETGAIYETGSIEDLLPLSFDRTLL